jgi:hypothetical protein
VSSSAPQPSRSNPGDLPPPSPSADPEFPTDKVPSGKIPSGAAQGPMTITGTVAAGVEANCLLLNGYLLIGGPHDLLRDGAKVTVTGKPQPGLMTTCQQGTPFVVDSAQAA